MFETNIQCFALHYELKENKHTVYIKQ